MVGKSSKRRNVRRKNAGKKAAQQERISNVISEKDPVMGPTITEGDLLAFQLSHFGDDTKPNEWFVDAETALNNELELAEEEVDDDLGYYEDGVKRTLTDAQIEMFRHSEIQQLIRDGKSISAVEDEPTNMTASGAQTPSQTIARRESPRGSESKSLFSTHAKATGPTHRRVVRELDEQRAESMELDY